MVWTQREVVWDWKMQQLSLFAQIINDSPVSIRHSKPLAIPWSDVDVDRAKVVVLLMTCQHIVTKFIMMQEEKSKQNFHLYIILEFQQALLFQIFIFQVKRCELPGVREPGTFMYSCTVFMPRILWPTWLSMLLPDTTRVNAGSLVSSASWFFHRSLSDKSTFVPNLIILGFFL